MVLIETVTLTPSGQSTAEAVWSGTGTVYADGKKIAGPAADGADLPLDPDEAYALEVHEADVDTIYMTPETHPTLRWRTVSGAEQYKIYHTPAGGSESLIWIQPEDGYDPYAVRSPVECAEGWHSFRIEAVDSGGNASTTTVFPVRVFAKPQIPGTLDVVTGNVLTDDGGNLLVDADGNYLSDGGSGQTFILVE